MVLGLLAVAALVNVAASRFHRAKRIAAAVWASAAFGVLTIACGAAAAFADQGTGNGSSRDFHLSAGIHRITYEATDREPFLGCNFGIALVTPSLDPLAPGRVIVQTDLVTIDQHGRRSDALVTPSLVEGQYTLRYLGDVPCDWTATVW